MSTKFTKPGLKFPLTRRADGRWCKQIAGKMYYFGKIADDPDGSIALERLDHEYVYLKANRTPLAFELRDGCTLQYLCESFLDEKRSKRDAGELTPNTLKEYHRMVVELLANFGEQQRVDSLVPLDFQKLRSKLASRLGPVSLKKAIILSRSVFKFALDQRLIDRSVHYGQSFDLPSSLVIRRARNEAGPRLFEAAELVRILDSVSDDPVLRAMALLGINCGFGNSDCSSLPQSAVDLDSGWVEFPRPKTGVSRRCPLWIETVTALREAIAVRPTPKNPKDAGLCFLTLKGNRWVRDNVKSASKNVVTVEFTKVLRRLHINGRPGLGFYTLRHVFETIGGESCDQVAVNAIMGHVDSSMAGQYRERISDDRLRNVVNTVRAWLFPDGEDQ